MQGGWQESKGDIDLWNVNEKINGRHVRGYTTDDLYVFCEVHLTCLLAVEDFEGHLQVKPCPECVASQPDESHD